jgi:hypothetical protein
MMRMKTITVCPDSLLFAYKDTVWENEEQLNVKADGLYIYNCPLKGLNMKWMCT